MNAWRNLLSWPFVRVLAMLPCGWLFLMAANADFDDFALIAVRSNDFTMSLCSSAKASGSINAPNS